VNDKANFPRSYVSPYTLRVFNSLPGNPASISATLALLLLMVFFGGRTLFDGGAGSTAGDLRIALIHILLTAYSVFAYTYLLTAIGKAAHDLAPVVDHSPRWQEIADRVGTYNRWGLVFTAFIGILIYLYATEITTMDADPWVWGQTNYDSRWMRVIGPFFAIWTSCFLYVLVVESARLSRLSETIRSLDLLDLRPYQPLIRLGLTNALLVVGMASILLLFLLEPGFVSFISFISILFAVYAWIGLMLPLRGIRKKISQAKEQELDWCRQALQAARTRLKSGASSEHSIVEITAYQNAIESIRNWPFDNPTLIRFALYLLIPLGTMFGGALVERGIELFVF
jgi:hypothetical protein